MRLLLLGLPGSGKSTVAELIRAALGLPVVAVHDIVRSYMEGTAVEERCRSLAFESFAAAQFNLEKYEDLLALLMSQRAEPEQIQNFMMSVKRNYTELRMRVLREQLERLQARSEDRFLLVGFPQDGKQAKLVRELLEELRLPLTHVLELAVDVETSVARSCGRMTHLPSGRAYHPIHRPPVHPGFDDVTGEPLVARQDDEVAVVRERARLYRRDCPGLFEALCGDPGARHVRIDAGRDSGGVRPVVEAALAAMGADPAAVDWPARGIAWSSPAAAPAAGQPQQEHLDEATALEMMA